MRVWITRTRPGAERTAARVSALGHDPVVAPVLEVRRRAWAPDLDGIGALAFTSANAVRVFADATADRGLPVFTVGDATAETARTVGFANIHSAGGDIGALVKLILGTGAAGEVLHVAGRPLAGDLEGELVRAGAPARTATLYETVPTAVSPPPGLDAVLVHSPHAASLLADAFSAQPALSQALFACISEAAAEPLHKAGASRVAVAVRPEERALLALLPPPATPS